MATLGASQLIGVDVPLATGLPANTAVPSGVEWQLQGAMMLFTSSATIGNRIPTIEIRDGSDVLVGRFGASVAQAASLSRRYSFGIGLSTDAQNNDVLIPMPQMMIPTGWVIRVTDLAGIDLSGDSSRTALCIMQERA